MDIPFITQDSEGQECALVFIHGFMGSAGEWKPFFKRLPKGIRPYAITLPGHDRTALSARLILDPDSLFREIDSFLRALPEKKKILAGYSMGGRIALEYLYRFGPDVDALILESTSPGIEDAQERRDRLQLDDERAAKMIEEGMTIFLNEWMRSPLFEGMKEKSPGEFHSLMERRRLQDPRSLAYWLTRFSPGKRVSLWDMLPTGIPALLLAGEWDKKYAEIMGRIRSFCPLSRIEILPGASHNVHFCVPDLYIKSVNSFLQEL